MVATNNTGEIGLTKLHHRKIIEEFLGIFMLS